MKVNRRNFLSLSGYTVLFSQFPSYSWSQINNNKILILIELQGANDGLNTVIPYNQDFYYNLRPTIGIQKSKILTIDNENGLHYSLKNLANLFEKGELKIIQNLGYPHPILSHFRSIDIWETGGDGKSQNRDGWLVKSLDEYSKKINLDAKAIFLDDSNSIFRGGHEGYLGPNALGLKAQKLEIRDSVFPESEKKNFELLNELIQKRKASNISLNKFAHKLENKKRYFEFGGLRNKGGQLAIQLSNVCNMIGAGINIPVFKTALGSFDTHNDQVSTHRRLLQNLDISISLTTKALKNLGVWKNTIIMTYSEFGRRAKENGSRGTDHGMAAPHFLIGGDINGGIVGEYEDLSNLWNNNINYKVDYRSLYEFVLREHFKIKNNPFSEFKDNIIV